jgi:hypothetical protein
MFYSVCACLNQHLCVYICIGMFVHVCACIVFICMYHANGGLLERHSVDGLAATPVLVMNVDGTEQLQSSVRLWHLLQPPQRRVEVFAAQLAMGAVGRKKLETVYPVRVIIDDETDNLVRQEMQVW